MVFKLSAAEMDFLTTHTNAALSEFEKVSDVTSE